MANFLQAVGIAQPANVMANTISAIQGMQLARQREALTNLQMTEALQKLKQNDIVFQEQQKQYEDAQKPVAWETFAQSLEGGPQSPMAVAIHDYAKGLGLLDFSQGGDGVLRKADIPRLKQMISQDPNFLTRLSAVRINYWREAVKEYQNMLLKKPNDENLQLKLKEASDKLNRALYQDEYTRKQLAAQQAARQAQERLAQQILLKRIAGQNAADVARIGAKSRIEAARIGAQSREKIARAKTETKPLNYPDLTKAPLSALRKAISTERSTLSTLLKNYGASAINWDNTSAGTDIRSAIKKLPLNEKKEALIHYKKWIKLSREYARRFGKNEAPSSKSTRERAIQILKSKGYPITEANIKYVIKQLKGQK